MSAARSRKAANHFAAKRRVLVTDVGRELQTRNELVVAARLETLIVGDGLDEAIKRADVYEDAGADAFLLHSRLNVAEEVFAFCEQYRGELPVMVVPTTCKSVTAPQLKA